jgi:hypothetical protein
MKKKGFWIAKEYDKNVGFKQKKGDGDDFTVRASKQVVSSPGGRSFTWLCARGFWGRSRFSRGAKQVLCPFLFFLMGGSIEDKENTSKKKRRWKTKEESWDQWTGGTGRKKKRFNLFSPAPRPAPATAQ